MEKSPLASSRLFIHHLSVKWCEKMWNEVSTATVVQFTSSFSQNPSHAYRIASFWRFNSSYVLRKLRLVKIKYIYISFPCTWTLLNRCEEHFRHLSWTIEKWLEINIEYLSTPKFVFSGSKVELININYQLI